MKKSNHIIFLIFFVGFLTLGTQAKNASATAADCKSNGEVCDLYDGGTGVCKFIDTSFSCIEGSAPAEVGVHSDAAAQKAGVAGATTSSKGLIPCGNPGQEACTLCHFVIGFHNLIEFLLKLAVTAALAGIFFAGVMYIISSGDETMMTSAKNFAKASVVGFTVVLGAWLIVNVTMWALSAKPGLGIGKTNWYTFDCSTPNSSSTANQSPTQTDPAKVKTADPTSITGDRGVQSLPKGSDPDSITGESGPMSRPMQ